MNDLFDTHFAAEIQEAPFAEALSERYLAYALSTIMSRSLPDVRDGLKPVHRRLLYAMRALHLDPAGGFKKCARVVGDVIGKLHPHGDTAVYDALVRLAQSFAVRYPLVDGQGNFGNIDGDNAAAMRYTEARLTSVAMALLEGIDEDAVDFRDTYDGEGREPVVLPARFPNLLANGATGIAVGMATSIPPHNAGEICDALLHLITYPKAGIDKLLSFMPGPDFPTGGVVTEAPEIIREAYATGRGSFRVRARWQVEKLSQGQYQIVVSEIPYMVAKSRLVEKLASLITEKKLALLGDVRDESDEKVRLVLEPKSRNVDPDILMAALFRQTELESRVTLNMNVLDGGTVPRVMSLREVLQAFLDHRHEVLVRRTKHRLEEIARRVEILEGYLIVYDHLDAIIKIIRNEDDPKPLLKKRWKLSDLQVEAILNMRLRALRKLEEKEIVAEHKALLAEEKELKRLLREKPLRWQKIAEEIKETRAQFAGHGKEKAKGAGKRAGTADSLGRRRTDIAGPPVEMEMPADALVEREPISILCSAKGWIRTVKGHLEDDAEVKYKEGDEACFLLHAQSTDRVVLFASNGRFYTLAADRLPGGRGHGEPLRLFCDLPNDAEPVALYVHGPGQRFLLAASDGRGFVVEGDEVVAQTRGGKQVLNLGKGAKARVCTPVIGDQVAVIGESRKMLIFPLGDLPILARGRGVVLQKYREGGLADAVTFDLAKGLSWRSGKGAHSLAEFDDWRGRRAQAGRLAPRGFPRSNRFQ